MLRQSAIYGARGANGVILVTTKKGETGKVNVEYNGYLTISKVDEYRRVRNGAEYLEYLREADRNYIYDGEGGYSIDPSCTYPSMTPSWEYDQKLEYIGSRDISGYVLESVKRAWEGGSYNPSMLRTFDWQVLVCAMKLFHRIIISAYEVEVKIPKSLFPVVHGQ